MERTPAKPGTRPVVKITKPAARVVLQSPKAKVRLTVSTVDRATASGLSAPPEAQAALKEKIQAAVTDPALAAELHEKAATRLANALCPLCRSPYIEEIEARVLRGERYSDIAKLYATDNSITPAKIRRHMNHRNAVETLEATSESIAASTTRYKEDVDALMARMYDILDTIEGGLVEYQDPATGKPVLNPTRIADFKPILDAIFKGFDKAIKLTELFARVNNILGESKGALAENIIIYTGAPPVTDAPTPVTIDARPETLGVDEPTRRIEVAGVDLIDKLIPDFAAGTEKAESESQIADMQRHLEELARQR